MSASMSGCDFTDGERKDLTCPGESPFVAGQILRFALRMAES